MRVSPIFSIVLGLAGSVLAIAIIYASGAASFSQSLALITHDPWGLVTLIDLYAGLIFAGILIFYLEGCKPSAWLWLVASLFLGNIVTAGWFLLRGRRLLAR
ncbi:MAG: hypothetical protein K2P80_05400 [Beijerinckiaceae bacterium]|nr:hypothetical protein [Beijerinckiaceae bacterium]